MQEMLREVLESPPTPSPLYHSCSPSRLPCSRGGLHSHRARMLLPHTTLPCKQAKRRAIGSALAAVPLRHGRRREEDAHARAICIMHSQDRAHLLPQALLLIVRLAHVMNRCSRPASMRSSPLLPFPECPSMRSIKLGSTNARFRAASNSAEQVHTRATKCIADHFARPNRTTSPSGLSGAVDGSCIGKRQASVLNMCKTTMNAYMCAFLEGLVGEGIEGGHVIHVGRACRVGSVTASGAGEATGGGHLSPLRRGSGDA